MLIPKRFNLKKVTETFTLMFRLTINAIHILRKFIEKIQHRLEIYYAIIIILMFNFYYLLN